MTSFKEKWLEAVDKKNSVLCAGLDPAESAMGRGEKGLVDGASKNIWAIEYVEAVAPYCAALKPNIQYWKSGENMDHLEDLTRLAHSKGLVVIEDSKLADIGPTNDAGVFYAADKKADAVTFSPFAGNIQEATKQAHARGLGLISMCLMSNPEYAREKNKLVLLSKEEFKGYNSEHIVKTDRGNFVHQYIQLANDANKFEVDGIVIGAPSKTNHIKDAEIYFVRENGG